MHRKQMARRVGFLVLLASLSVAAIPGTADAPQGVEPDAISCGDSAVCSMSGNALYVQNTGSGASIYGNSLANGIGVRGKGSPGVYGYSYHGTGVRGKSENGYGLKAQSNTNYALYAGSTGSGGAYLRSASNALPDLVLGGLGGNDDDGTISSEPADVDSDLVFYANDRLYIHLDQDNNSTTADFRIYNGADDEILRLTGGGDLSIRDDLLIAGIGGGGSIASIAASDSYMSLISNSNVNVLLDDDDNEPDACFNIAGEYGAIIWNLCESRGSTTVGSQAVAVETSSGSREMYAMGSPGLWFEDFGSAALVDGHASVAIDPLFAETVNLDAGYHVFVQVYGNADVYVANRSRTHFEVDLRDGEPDVEFSYRIVAKRLGYESQRLAEVDLAPMEEGEP